MIANILKFTFGILLALAIIVGGGLATALYLMNRTSAPPPKPIYANDSPALKGQNPKAVISGATKKPVALASKAKVSTQPTPSPTTSPKAATPKPLPPGSYQARVSWPQGLSLRSQPLLDAERIGGVGFNSKVIVLQESDDKVWQKIRLEGSEQEGWVKAGNTRKVNEQEDSQLSEQGTGNRE